uniref:DNA-directed DNA polymerase family A palm domain-containing protein n=1 Tax=Mucochytrium quahogii TaxID=96639 RepID=A0A7S2RII9_9STRA|mmetsp:Transcript_15714/g.27390  ORF Transcript_15714/g.27390 Transcript_15714/m.27390 type:complete len:801 (+) Transcript_15714:375-2777(+)
MIRMLTLRSQVSNVFKKRHLCGVGYFSTSSAMARGEKFIVEDLVYNAPYKPLVIATESAAKRFMEQSMALPKSRVFGCDTECEIDIKNQSPVGNGYLTCITIFSGDYFDGGNHIFIDLLSAERDNIIEVIKPFFNLKRFQKVWHNYGFDRHILYNEGIDAHGLKGDTMHMARLYDSSLDKISGGKGYSLEGLCATYDVGTAEKTAMKDLFGVPKLKKDGTPGKVKTLPSIGTIQADPESRDRFIKYACDDARCTTALYHKLREKLRKEKWKPLAVLGKPDQTPGSMFDLYELRLCKFAEVLTDLEREGFQVDHEQYLPEIEKLAKEDIQRYLNDFMSWATESGAFESKDDIPDFNWKSSRQLQGLFFAKDGVIPGKTNGANKPATFPGKKVDENGKTKSCTRTFKGLGVEPLAYTKSGGPVTDRMTFSILAGDPESEPPRFGPLKEQMDKKGEDGKRACLGVHNLNKASANEKLLSTFIEPLQRRVDKNGRIHCKLQFSTETGRLSSSGPNLQNQPALEKDIYKIRKAFVARPGCKLIVADYGQLELRVLAHLADCKSMKEAFEIGGDFHSRTAMGMFDYISKEEKEGKVILEWDYAKGPKPEDIPLIKDKYASERRMAKVLNFSIAYGKTEYGLAKDFGKDLEEAKEILDKWYASRPEVKQWQQEMRKQAKIFGYVRTMWGRRRYLPAYSRKPPASSTFRSIERDQQAALRAAINTPIQGSAADIVMGAMIKISNNKELKELGWKMILQVHDEIIVEGPEETADIAMEHVVNNMEHPFEKGGFPLVVDANQAYNWYDAK